MWTQESWYTEAKNWASKHKEFVNKMALLNFNMLKNHLPDKADSEILEMVVEYSKKRINAPIDFKKYPELRGVRELIVAEWKGIEDGAGLDDGLTAVYTNGMNFYHRMICTGKIGKMDGFSEKAKCSYIFFPDSDHGPLLANNLDTSPEEPFDAPEWPALNEHLIIGSVSSGIFLDEEPEEIFPAPVFKIVARYCRNAPEAVEILERYNQFWGPCNAIVIDREKRCAMIEKSACRMGVRWSKDGFGFITAMTAEHPEMNAYLNDRRQASLKARNLGPGCADEVYWKKQDQRRLLMNELLDQARKNPTLETMRRFIQFRDPVRGNVCGNGETYVPGGAPSEYTVRTIIWLLKEGRALWWAREGNKPSYENPMPEVKFENVLLWE
ncbi:MAG: hypothetical protein NC906_06145 [Candidatus Omnitrophica bacterium]|nr:hypothetical protein [Candidatus Omnitrophota bacterium]